MRSRAYIPAISVTLFFCLFLINKANACSAPSYTPAEYYTFRIYDAAELDKSEATKNCELWQKMTSANIPITDIYQAIYKFSYDEVLGISALIKKPDIKDALMGNKFVEWIVRHHDREIADFLSLAKLCEKARWEQNSPWYYPTDGDDVSVTLSDVADRAMADRGKRLQDRYALQAVRALFATARYDECINFWNDRQHLFPNGLIKQMIKPYIAGAYYRTGAVERAMRIYAECGDVKSLFYCAGKKEEETNEIVQMELAYSRYPDSPAFPPIIQRLIRETEAYGMEDGREEKCLQLLDFALRVANEGKASNLAMWYYTAAFIADLRGETQRASNILSKAEAARGSNFVKESIKVLRIYLDAKLLPYNTAYEQKLFAQLQWFDNKIKSGLKEITFDEESDLSSMISCNISCYYWNDMLRKIVLSVVVPRYETYGNYVRAIQLTNMAENLLTKQLFNKALWQIDYDSYGWNGNYRTDLFTIIDTVEVNHVIAYAEKTKHPRSAFDRFLDERGYIDHDYLNEIIGTKCLREMRYADAVKYFERVPSSFQYTLNTYRDGYMWRDPFSTHMKLGITDKSDYKYNFAREMASLEQAIAQTQEPNRKAQLMLRYAAGITNSINDCWALTHYYQSDYNDWKHPVGQWQRADEKSKKLFKDALAIFTDNECAAYAHWQLGYYKTVVAKYPDTHTAEYVKRHCDNLRDYKAK